MLDSPISRLPIGTRIAIQSADADAFKLLCWHGFHMESGEVVGTYIMRRDFCGGWPADAELSPPRFPITILTNQGGHENG
jgi:hypothetical protein